jgi:hypothetical protein
MTIVAGRNNSNLVVVPMGVTVDYQKNVYISDWNNTITKISTNGVRTTIVGQSGEGFAGDGLTPSLAQVRKPTGISVDHHGNLYFADTYNHRVRLVNFTPNTINTILVMDRWISWR